MKRVVAALCLFCGVGCSEDAKPRPELSAPSAPAQRAIVILLDAARADRFSCNGYERETTPNMDRLAARGMLYPNHYANGVNTRTSMPTLLYSRYFVHPVFPMNPSVPVYKPSELFRALDDAAVSFPEVLSAAGIHTAGISAHQWFVASSEFHQAFDEFHDLPREIEYERKYRLPRGEQVVDLAIDWIDAAGADTRYMLYLHLMDTHFPHFLDEDAAEFFGADEYVANRFVPGGMVRDISQPLTGRDRDYMDAIYDGSLRYTDRELGRLFDHLEQEGLLDDTAILITADHGENLLHRANEFTHGNWREDVARIPMIVSCPSILEPGVSTAITQGVDLLPTLVELMGVEPPTGFSPDGQSLLGKRERAQSETAYSRFGARVGDRKLIVSRNWAHDLDAAFDQHSSDPDAVWADVIGLEYPFELFDLGEDPGSTRNLWGDNELSRAAFEDYFAALKPAYQRFVENRKDIPPSGGFAIFPRDFEADSEVRSFVSPTKVESVEELRFVRGWSHFTGEKRSFLLAKADADWLDIAVEIPSGAYELSACIDGAGFISAPGMTKPAKVRDRKVTSPLPRNGERVAIGTIDVIDAKFEAQIKPTGKTSYFRISSLSFVPVGSAGSGLSPEQEAERLKALEALGYVNGES